MHTLDWDDVRHFLQVVRSGSATQAAARLGINHTTVYRRIAALEDRLGKSLFERSSSGWVLTPVGERIVAFAESMAEEAHNIERQILAESHELSGLLRVTAADHCVERLVMPATRKFIQRYPQIDLEVVATADEVDLAAREADVALRGTDQPPPNLVGKRIAQIGFAIYGTQALKQRAALDPDADRRTGPGLVGPSPCRPAHHRTGAHLPRFSRRGTGEAEGFDRGEAACWVGGKWGVSLKSQFVISIFVSRGFKSVIQEKQVDTDIEKTQNGD